MLWEGKLQGSCFQDYAKVSNYTIVWHHMVVNYQKLIISQHLKLQGSCFYWRSCAKCMDLLLSYTHCCHHLSMHWWIVQRPVSRYPEAHIPTRNVAPGSSMLVPDWCISHRLWGLPKCSCLMLKKSWGGTGKVVEGIYYAVKKDKKNYCITVGYGG